MDGSADQPPADISGSNVLVTGGLGFIGSCLVHECLRRGAQVSVYDCLDPRSGGSIHNVREIEDAIEVVLGDVRNLESLATCIRGKDVVFNCAAYTSHPQSMKEPIIDIDVNCKGTINVLEAARRFNPNAKIVHVGTSTQIGRMVSSPVDERHSEFPLDIYSANKVAAEKYVLIYGNAYGMRTTVIRLANVFGPRSNIQSPDFGFVNYFIGLALLGREIPIYGHGTQLRNISYVEDCVEALIAAAASDSSDGEVFFAVADRQCSVAEVATEVAAVIGGKVHHVAWPRMREAIEVGDAVLSNHKINAVLGWRPRYGLREGMERTRDYFVPRLELYLR